MKHSDRKPEKKSESLDIRLPHSVKTAFMAAAKQRGETASEAVRRFIDVYVKETPSGTSEINLKDAAMTLRKNPFKTIGIAALAGGAMTLAALPSAAADDTFKILDRNADGVLTAGEISGDDKDLVVIEALDTDKSGSVSPEEFKLKTSVTKIDRKESSPTGKPVKVYVSALDAEISEDGEYLKTSIYESVIKAAPDLTDAEVEAIATKAVDKMKAQHAKRAKEG